MDYLIIQLRVNYLIEEPNTTITENGNFLWAFCNTEDIDTDRNGYMGIRLLDHRVSVTPDIFGSNQQTVNPSVVPEKKTWYHVAYVQEGTTGKIYINGELAATNTVTNLPSTTLVVDGRDGTYYNWIGRSCYVNDTYLSYALIHDFQVYNVAASGDDVS